MVPKRSHKKTTNSPASYPHKHGKVGPKRQEICNNNYVTVWEIPFYVNDGSDECKEREKLENKIYSYMFAKQVMPCDTNFAEFKPFTVADMK